MPPRPSFNLCSCSVILPTHAVAASVDAKLWLEYIMLCDKYVLLIRRLVALLSQLSFSCSISSAIVWIWIVTCSIVIFYLLFHRKEPLGSVIGPYLDERKAACAWSSKPKSHETLMLSTKGSKQFCDISKLDSAHCMLTVTTIVLCVITSSLLEMNIKT